MLKNRVKSWLHTMIQMIKEEKLHPVPKPVNTTELLNGKVALITGGSGGIGCAMAEAFLNNGAAVIIAGTSEQKLKECAEKLGRDETKLKSIVIDVLEVQSLTEKVKAASEMFGKIDILVNAAGLVAHHGFLDILEEEYDSIMDVNAKGTFFMSQAVGKYMIKNKIRGHILNVTSSSALRPAWTPYQMSKWAVRGFTLGAADVLLPYGIIVNAIAPGPVATPMLGKKEGDSIYMEKQPSGRYAMPSEIANMSVMLVSELGDLVVGDSLYMTGGSGNLSCHS